VNVGRGGDGVMLEPSARADIAAPAMPNPIDGAAASAHVERLIPAATG
jgi:hypothetical protein